MEFAKKYEDEAKKNLNKNFEFMKQLNVQEPTSEEKEKIKEKYKQLEPTQEKKEEIKEKYKDLERTKPIDSNKKEKVVLEEGKSIVRNFPVEENIILENEEQVYRDWETDRKSTRLNSSHRSLSRMPSSA